ncbi:MAG: type II toxin-antitoxin system VapC family toxin [Chloroflexota bacterium]
MIVIDASVTLAWCLKDEQSDYANAILDRVVNEGAVAPAHWPLEVANGLLVAERRGRIAASVVDDIGRTLDALAIDIRPVEFSTAFWGALQSAREYNLSEYDAAYLDLSQVRELPLATIDAKLRAAAEKSGIEIAS